MNLYVDPLFTVPPSAYHGPDAAQASRTGARWGHRWCHLFADVADCPELHAFAARLGMRREWFQGDHYDLVPSKRAAAVRLGAAEVDRARAVEIWRGQRSEPRENPSAERAVHRLRESARSPAPESGSAAPVEPKVD